MVCACESECDVPVPGIPVPGNLSFYLMLSEKFGVEKSLGTGFGKKLGPKKSRNWSQKYLVSVPKFSGLETFPLDLFKPFVSFSHIYVTISCQNFGVSLGLGIGLVPFPGLLYFLDGIGTGLEKIWERKMSRN